MTNEEKLAASLATVLDAYDALIAASGTQEIQECLDVYRDAAIAHEHAVAMASAGAEGLS